MRARAPAAVWLKSSPHIVDFGLGAGQAVILGAVTGVGGGTLRDVLVRRVPTVLRSGLYAIPALIGAVITVITIRAGVYGIPAALAAAAACFHCPHAGRPLRPQRTKTTP